MDEKTDQKRDWIEKRYLLIDDFSGIRTLLRDMLRSLGVRTTDQAASGADAIAMLEKNKYDVVLCDYNLGPGRNGQHVLEEARLRELVGPACIWLMVSAEKSVESVMGAAEHQPDGYLIKPIAEALLLSRLNRVWSKKQVFKEIDVAYSAKDYLKAAKLCDDRLTTEKLHAVDLLRMKASLLLKSGEPEQARAVYEEVLAEREYVWAKTGLAKVHLQNGKHEAAKVLLQEVLAENANFLDAYDHLALAHQELGELSEAEQVLASAAKVSPNSVLRQRNLGRLAMKLGNIAVAERALKKSVEVGEHSILKTPDAYFELARVLGQKNDARQALQVLDTVQRAFNSAEVWLRAKVTEGLVYHESGDYIKARKSGEEMGRILAGTSLRPDIATSLDMARLLFAGGARDAAVKLLQELVKNNHDNEQVAEEVQQIFDKANMSEQGADLVSAARKEASEMMNRGALLWQGGKLAEAADWMRNARAALPSNVRVLLNFAHILISAIQQQGGDSAPAREGERALEELADEAREVLLLADQLAPSHPRFAQLMELLNECLAPGDDGVFTPS